MRDYIIGGALIVAGLVAFASTAFVAPTPEVKLDHVTFGSGVLTPKHVIDWRFPEGAQDWR